MHYGHYSDIEVKTAPQVPGTKGTKLRWLTDPSSSDIFFMRHVIIEEGGAVGLHNHPNEHQIYVIKGKGKASVDGEECTLTEGGFVLFPGGAMHSLENVGEGDLEVICCITRVDE